MNILSKLKKSKVFFVFITIILLIFLLMLVLSIVELDEERIEFLIENSEKQIMEFSTKKGQSLFLLSELEEFINRPVNSEHIVTFNDETYIIGNYFDDYSDFEIKKIRRDGIYILEKSLSNKNIANLAIRNIIMVLYIILISSYITIISYELWNLY